MILGMPYEVIFAVWFAQIAFRANLVAFGIVGGGFSHETNFQTTHLRRISKTAGRGLFRWSLRRNLRLNQRSRGKSRTIQTPFSLICGLFRPAKGAETFYIWEIGVEIMADEPRMPLTHAGCAEKAEDCRQDARHESNSQHRALLEHMATNWDRIALSIRSNRDDEVENRCGSSTGDLRWERSNRLPLSDATILRNS